MKPSEGGKYGVCRGWMEERENCVANLKGGTIGSRLKKEQCMARCPIDKRAKTCLYVNVCGLVKEDLRIFE